MSFCDCLSNEIQPEISERTLSLANCSKPYNKTGQNATRDFEIVEDFNVRSYDSAGDEYRGNIYQGSMPDCTVLKRNFLMQARQSRLWNMDRRERVMRVLHGHEMLLGLMTELGMRDVFARDCY